MQVAPQPDISISCPWVIRMRIFGWHDSLFIIKNFPTPLLPTLLLATSLLRSWLIVPSDDYRFGNHLPRRPNWLPDHPNREGKQKGPRPVARLPARNMRSLRVLLVIALLLISGAREQAASPSNGYGRRLDPIELTSTWSYFYFEQGGSLSSPTFFINAKVGDAIQMTDLFCAGDLFTLLLDIPQPNLHLSFNSSTVPTSCSPYVTDPWSAFISGTFSRLSYTFPQALYANMTVRAAISPYGNGAGAIRKFP